MLQHTVQISHVGIAPAYISKVARMRFLVLITATVCRDDGAVTRRKAVYD
jgi:hypothetical protein